MEPVKEKQIRGGEMEAKEDKLMKRYFNQLLQELAKGIIGHELDAYAIDGIQVLQVKKGLVRCSFVVNNRDGDGKWHPGAIAIIMDVVGAAAVHTSTHRNSVSIDFTIYYYGTAKHQEEVEIEAKVEGKKGKMTAVVIEVKRKDNAELVAVGKQWMASSDASPTSKL